MAKAAPKKAAPVVEAEPEMSIFDALQSIAVTDNPDFEGQSAGETNRAFTERLLGAIAEVPDETFSLYAPEGSDALDYFNEALTAINDGKMPPAMPGMPAPVKKAAPAAAAPAKAAPAKRAVKAAPEPEPEPEEEPEEEPVEEEPVEEEPVEEAPAPKKVAAKKAAPAAAPVAAKPAGKVAAKPVAVKPGNGQAEPAAKKEPFGGNRAPAFERNPNGVTYQIRLILAKNPKADKDAVTAALAKKGFQDVKMSTITTLIGDVGATIRAIQEAGHWK